MSCQPILHHTKITKRDLFVNKEKKFNQNSNCNMCVAMYHHRDISYFDERVYPSLCPRIRLASCISLAVTVTRFEWTAQSMLSSNSSTRKASVASCRAITAASSHRRGCQFISSVIRSAISRTTRWKGSFLINRSADFW